MGSSVFLNVVGNLMNISFSIIPSVSEEHYKCLFISGLELENIGKGIKGDLAPGESGLL